jgi:hypothetical protein
MSSFTVNKELAEPVIVEFIGGIITEPLGGLGADDNVDDENLDDTEKLLETTSSPQVIDVTNESHNDVYASVNKLSKEEEDTRETQNIIDTNEEIQESDRYEVGESAIILSDDNDGGDHFYEHIEVVKDQQHVPEDEEIPIFHDEDVIVVTKEHTVQPVEERKKEKKKKKSKDKTDEEKSKKKQTFGLKKYH